MDIDNDRRVLVLTATSQSDPTWCEFYRVDGVLKLRQVDGELQGHPGIDFDLLGPRDDGETVWASGYHLPVSTVRKIRHWMSQGLFIALTVTSPGKRKRNRKDLAVSWAKPEQYLTDEDMLWLDAYCQSSFIYTDARDNRAAWQRIFSGLAEIATAIGQQPKLQRKAKQPKSQTKRKQRRRREREARDYGHYMEAS
jgi:hypothetical protein